MKKSHKVKALCESFDNKNLHYMKSFQFALDIKTQVATLPWINAKFLSSHPVAMRSVEELLDILADCVTTSIKRKASATVYPIDMASDGTMTMPPEEVVVKAIAKLDFSNFGSSRLGVAVVCDRLKPLGFKVVVGPFFELLGYVKAAVAEMEVMS